MSEPEKTIHGTVIHLRIKLSSTKQVTETLLREWKHGKCMWYCVERRGQHHGRSYRLLALLLRLLKKTCEDSWLLPICSLASKSFMFLAFTSHVTYRCKGLAWNFTVHPDQSTGCNQATPKLFSHLSCQQKE